MTSRSDLAAKDCIQLIVRAENLPKMAISLEGVSDLGQRGGGHGPITPLNTQVITDIVIQKVYVQKVLD